MHAPEALPRAALAAAAAALALILLGCEARALAGHGPAAAAGSAAKRRGPRVNEACRIRARSLFKTSCQPCHGEVGGGDGPGAASLKPKPRNFRDPEWQRSVSDEEIELVILRGGAAMKKSAGMPASQYLEATPGVVAALREMVRDLGPRSAEGNR